MSGRGKEGEKEGALARVEADSSFLLFDPLLFSSPLQSCNGLFQTFPSLGGLLQGGSDHDAQEVLPFRERER